MNGILINGVFHEAIQSDTASFKCDQCSLKDFCEEIGTSTLSYFPSFLPPLMCVFHSPI